MDTSRLENLDQFVKVSNDDCLRMIHTIRVWSFLHILISQVFSKFANGAAYYAQGFGISRAAKSALQELSPRLCSRNSGSRLIRVVRGCAAILSKSGPQLAWSYKQKSVCETSIAARCISYPRNLSSVSSELSVRKSQDLNGRSTHESHSRLWRGQLELA